MTELARSDVESTATHWNRAFREEASVEHQAFTYALASPMFQKRYINRYFAQDAPDWVEGLRRALDVRAPFERALVLGCGLGDALFELVRLGVVRRIHGIDVSTTAIEQGRARAASLGLSETVTFGVGDFHDGPLERGGFDLVLMVMSLHHALDLDVVLENVRAALSPNGLFIVNEYIGPNRWQFTTVQLALVNALLRVLPRGRRRRRDGSIKERVYRPTIEGMLAMDPSEAAHSAEIPDSFARHFELLHRVDYGCGIAVPVLDEIIANFREDDRSSMAWFRLVVGVDELAYRTGIVPSANAFLVGRRK